MSDELVIGKVHIESGVPDVPGWDVDLCAEHLSPEHRRYWEIGMRASEAKDYKVLLERMWKIIRQQDVRNPPTDEIITMTVREAHASGLASAAQRIAELEHERDPALGLLRAEIKNFAELEHELEIARALQPPAPEPEVKTGTTATANAEGLAFSMCPACDGKGSIEVGNPEGDWTHSCNECGGSGKKLERIPRNEGWRVEIREILTVGNWWYWELFQGEYEVAVCGEGGMFETAEQARADCQKLISALSAQVVIVPIENKQ